LALRASLLAALPSGLRDPLFSEYDSLLFSYLESRWGPAELSAGKLCEIVYTILAGFASGSYPQKPGKPKDFVSACRALESNTHAPRSFQILIPRLLPGLYEVRNNRGVGHVGGDVDPNAMDAAFVVASARWILAELIRVLHSVSIEEAQKAVDELSQITSPLVWSQQNVRRVLDCNLSLKEQILLLVASSPGGSTYADLKSWIEPENESYFLRTIRTLHKNRVLEFTKGSGHVGLLPTGSRAVAHILTRKKA
jgi:hypothetical protein